MAHTFSALINMRNLSTGSALVAVATALYTVHSDEGLTRTVNFWARAMPVYMHYRVTQWWTKNMSEVDRTAAFERLHNTHANTMEMLVLDLRGFYLKLAQIGSTRDEFLPDQYLRWAKKTQGNVPSIYSTKEIHDVVEKSYGRSLHTMFLEWNDVPIGAASIGQVHRAVLLDGTQVAVKVMYPNIEQKFRADVATAKTFCALAQPAHLPFMSEVEKQFLTEFDYRGEAKNLHEIRRNIMPQFGSQVNIPKPITEMCTKHVLVMEYLPGVPLLDGIKMYYKSLANAKNTTLEKLEAEHHKQIRSGIIQPSSISSAKRKYFLYSSYIGLRNAFSNLCRFLYNWPIGHLIGYPLTYRNTRLPLNLAHILELLLRVHGHQLFVNGCFNGDPHPGNILLLDDGRLGLIDYGQVKRIDENTRLSYARLIVALAEDDRQRIVEIFQDEMGVRTQHNDPEILYRLACFFHDRDTEDIMGNLNIQLFMEEMNRKDPILRQSDEFVMAGRLSILMRGMGNAFQLKLRTAQAWLPQAKALLAQHNALKRLDTQIVNDEEN